MPLLRHKEEIKKRALANYYKRKELMKEHEHEERATGA